MNLSKNTKLTKVQALASSSGTDTESASVDMQGFEGVMFFGRIESKDVANWGNVQQSSDDGGSDTFANLEGTAVITTVDANSFLIDIYRPLERYLRVFVERGGTNTIVGDIYALQYGAKTAPTTQGSTIEAEMHVSPAEGAV